MPTLLKDTRETIREAARECMDLWPNAHLGDVSRREDLASFFRILRRWIKDGCSPAQAARRLSCDAQRYHDM